MPSKIEWTGETWNPVTGCTKVSPGCANCYAERMAKRLAGRYGYPADDPFRVTLHPDRLGQPLRWKKPKRIFVCSMSDLFHKDVPRDFLKKVLGVAMFCHWHRFFFLTKRHQEMVSTLQMDDGLCYADTLAKQQGQPYFRHGDYMDKGHSANMYFGVTTENQEWFDKRVWELLRVGVARRFVSAEPMLGPIDATSLTFLDSRWSPGWNYLEDAPRNYYEGDPDTKRNALSVLDGVICGGESGPGARPMHPDWPRALRDQCQAVGVPFFFKQWGAWREMENDGGDAAYPERRIDSSGRDVTDTPGLWSETDARMIRVGKKAAGRTLDGKIHDELPGVTTNVH